MYNFLIHENVFLIIQDDVNDNKYFSLYKTIYNFLIHENVFLIIQDDV